MLETQIIQHNNKYSDKNWLQSLSISLITLSGLFFCFKNISIWIIPLMSLLLVKMFIIMHDMGHTIFFPSILLNNIIGNIFGTILTLSFSYWVKEHKIHHANSNNLDKPQVAQSAPLDISRFKVLSYHDKLYYWLLYGRYTLFTTTPFIYFIFLHRLQASLIENILFVLYSSIVYSYNSWTNLTYILLSYYFAGMLGSIIFHLQHTFDNGYKETNDKWTNFNNGYYGSSFLQIPWLLSCFTNAVEYHHIHHISPFIPCYNLAKCHHEAIGLYDKVPKVYLTDVLWTYSYNIYNYATKSYDDLQRLQLF